MKSGKRPTDADPAGTSSPQTRPTAAQKKGQQPYLAPKSKAISLQLGGLYLASVEPGIAATCFWCASISSYAFLGATASHDGGDAISAVSLTPLPRGANLGDQNDSKRAPEPHGGSIGEQSTADPDQMTKPSNTIRLQSRRSPGATRQFQNILTSVLHSSKCSDRRT